MSFRIEQKILIGKNQIIEFKNLYQKKKLKKLYPQRVIKSLYFEDLNYNMYKDSVEGVLPRKKIRIRNYPNEDGNKFYLEKKISSFEGRYKEKKKISISEYNKILKSGIYDYDYGYCKPLLYVEYKRNYYILDQSRVTHDTQIKYYKFKNKIIKKDENDIFEIKTHSKADLDELFLTFPMDRTRFSKYCNGFDKLFN